MAVEATAGAGSTTSRFNLVSEEVQRGRVGGFGLGLLP